MGKGGKRPENGTVKVYQWNEIEKHSKRDDTWIVIKGKVYDVTNFMTRHPGGSEDFRVVWGPGRDDDCVVYREISSEGNCELLQEDFRRLWDCEKLWRMSFNREKCSILRDVWTSMHNDKEFVGKYMKPLCIGEAETVKETELEQDFRQLRKYVEDNGLLRVNPMFYVWNLISILALEVIGYHILSRFGTSWLPYIAAAVCFLISQAQAGWLQHDFGHLSVFRSRKLNHIAHHLIIGHLKIDPSSCLDLCFLGCVFPLVEFRHFLHHAKPNIIKVDPDIKAANLFLMGEVLPKLWGEKKRGSMPYQFQHIYFLLLSPLLLPTYFVFENLFFVLKRKEYWDLFFTVTFFWKMFGVLSPVLGVAGTFWFFMFVRALESLWFVWCTQMSHIPNEVDFDHAKTWFQLQLDSTCNVTPSFFNDWFSGHLNYQIEHHLFPMMPRHNYAAIAPLVKSIAKKHGVNYRCKDLLTAFGDIMRSLEHSGELWYNAYYEGITQ